MKKKVATIITSLVLCLMMGTSALAVPSAGHVTPERPSAIVNGQKVELVYGTTTGTESKAAVTFFEEWNNKAAELEKQLEDGTITAEEYDKKWEEEYQKCIKAALTKYLGVTCDKVEWYNYKNLSLPKGVTMPEGDIDVTVTDTRIKAGDQLIVMHITSDGKYELIKVSEVKDGSFTGHFNSLSPIYYFAASNVKTASQPAAAPKTGEMDMTVVIFAGVALLGVLGAVSCKKRAF